MRLRTVGDLVHDHRADETILVAASSSAGRAARLMAEHEVQAVLVMDGADLPIGVFSSRELIERVVLPGRDASRTPLSLVTDRKVHRISDGTSLEVALALMNMYRCSHLIVGDGPRATGLVSMRDVATQLLRAEEAAEERPHVAAEDESHRRPTASQDLTAVH